MKTLDLVTLSRAQAVMETELETATDTLEREYLMDACDAISLYLVAVNNEKTTIS